MQGFRKPPTATASAPPDLPRTWRTAAASAARPCRSGRARGSRRPRSRESESNAMSDLTNIERRQFERLLQMGGGYVLDFSNRTFAEFVADSVGRNIYDPRYAYAS